MPGIVSFAWAHARGDWRRSLAAAFAIMVAVTSLVVLTGSVTTERLNVTGTVTSNFRSTYDILVRPKGAATTLEQSLGAVRPNFLTGTYGGISLDQVTQIQGVPNVDVAAPVAVLGLVTRNVRLAVNVDEVLGSRSSAMVRFALDGTSRNGTGKTTTGHGYLYLTRAPLTVVDSPGRAPSQPAQVEQRATGPVTVCLASDAGGRPATPNQTFSELCQTVTADMPATVESLLSIPMAVEAIDPTAEQRLTGLDAAIVDGRPLTQTDSTGTAQAAGGAIDTATALMASELPFDFQARLTVEELDNATISQMLATNDAKSRQALVESATPVRTVATLTRDASTAYSNDIVANVSKTATTDESLFVSAFVQPGQVSYSGTTTVTPTVVPCDPTIWLSDPNGTDFLPVASSVCDTGFRSVTVAKTRTDLGGFLSFDVVGKYDPAKIERPSALNDVPLETYRSPVITGADAASIATLGGKPLLSDLNPAGYVQSPPAVLVSLKALPLFWKHVPDLNQTAPVSSVRVRVAGVTGITPADRERIRVVAEQIQKATGLAVDITAGASLANQPVTLPAAASGTPALVVNEQWTKKGVAVAIADAVDGKSVFLLALVLASSALTVWLTATASVRSRRRELGTLSCLGWTAQRLRTAILTELALIGAGAGVVGLVVALPVAAGLHSGLAWEALVGAVPLGVLLAVVPGLAATTVAGRMTPADLFRPSAARSRGPRRVGGPFGVGLSTLAQHPGRIAVGVLGVALAVSSGSLLAGVVSHFHETLIGSFLGDAVAVQVRTPDVAAVVLIALLGLTAVATLLFLGLVEDARGLAALRAIGWTDTMLVRTILGQALVIGVFGSITGGIVAIVIWRLAFGPWDAPILLATVLVAAFSVAACVMAAIGPAAWAGRLPTARILSSE